MAVCNQHEAQGQVKSLSDSLIQVGTLAVNDIDIQVLVLETCIAA